MNYHILKQIINESLQYPKIKLARRVAENKIRLELANSSGVLDLIIDLQGVRSSISSGQIYGANYKSAFDEALRKCLNGAVITNSYASEHNRIWHIKYERAGAYRKECGSVVVEFLGRKNNFILLDELGRINSALRYVSERGILIGEPYSEPQANGINDKDIQITNIKQFLSEQFNEQKQMILSSLKTQYASNLLKKLALLKSKLNALPSQDELASNAARQYAKADLLKANLYKLKPYEREFELEGEKFSLIKQPSLALKDIYKSAKKFAAKAAGVQREKDSLNAKIFEIQASIDAIYGSCDESLLRLSFAKQAKRTKEQAKPGVVEFFINDYKISIGLNEAANARLLSKAKKSDWWFHLQAKAGAHAILQTAKKQPDIDIIYQTALLVATHSGINSGTAMVDFTQRSKLTRSGGSNSAHVTYNEFDSIKVFFKD